MLRRKYVHIRIKPGDPYSSEREFVSFVPKDHANLVTSLVQSDDLTLHAPCLDIDMPCRLMESKTPGHYHLYIERMMLWRQYKKLLKALAEAGIIEKGWYRSALKHKFTVLSFSDETMPVNADAIVEDLDSMIDGT